MNIGVGGKNKMIGFFVKMIIRGILARVTVNVINGLTLRCYNGFNRKTSI